MTFEKYNHIYFDTNFFSLMRTDSGSKINVFNDSCAKFKILKKDYQPVVTPFLFLETIGLPMKSVGLPNVKCDLKITSIDDLDIYKNEIFEQAYNFYSTHKILSKENITEYVNAQHYRGSEFGKKLFSDIISVNTQIEKFDHQIHWALAYDYIQKHLNYPKNFRDILIHSCLFDLGRSSVRNLNISQARVIKHVWDKHVDLFVKNRDITKSQKSMIKKREYCFKTTSDLVDTEITHFANIGWLIKNEYHPVMCVTCDDNIEKIKFRLGLYKSQVKSLHESLIDISNQPTHNFRFQEGAVVVCSRQTGEIKEIIELEQLNTIL